MAAYISISPLAMSPPVVRPKPNMLAMVKFAISCHLPRVGGLRLGQKIQYGGARLQSPLPRCSKTRPISCSMAKSEILQIVQSTIANQLSIDESTVTPQTKFADLGADSLDTVEIMMALEERFQVSIGEGGAENIATVQDAAELIEKVKAEGA
ncbi:uncharacterized protein [Elaeis guineensis]|uniref:uncharacterized protein isoform X1 n=1 Tax=Elaeis guineensis var. tenera TaxID=51953 RepID=UPI003C6CDA0D